RTAAAASCRAATANALRAPSTRATNARTAHSCARPLPRGLRFHRRAFLRDAFQQVVPGFHERRRALALQLPRERCIVDAGGPELRDHLLAIAAVLRHRTVQLAVVGESQQGLVGHRVDGVGRGQRLDIQRVRRLRILGAGAGPQQALWMRWPIAMPRRSFSSAGTLSVTATSQRLMNTDATESTLGDLPSAMRRSMPRIQASAAARYCSRENSSVTLIGTPR